MARPLTRRSFVAGSLAASAAGVAQVATADAADVSLYLGPALEPELITVTDVAAAWWWWTEDETDTAVRITPLDGPGAGAARWIRRPRRTRVHVARVDDLRPGTRYAYELWSGGRRVSLGTGDADPGAFRTLVPPPGRRLATIALLNDLHVGERCSGTVTDALGPSLPPCFSSDAYPDYAHRMVADAITELHRVPVDLVIANGDLTDRGRETEVARALAQLRRLGRPLLVTRGNHDRRLEGACAADGDCLRALAFPGQAVGDAPLRSVARVGERLAVVGLDSADPDSGAPDLLHGDQPAWLDRQLTALDREGRDVIVAFHHPLLVPIQGVGADAGADAVLAVLGRHRHVRLVVHGHTHANALQLHDAAPGLPFLQNGAIKEYPSGYALLHVHEGGIMRTFHRPDTAWSRTWTATSARQVWGLHPTATRGTLATRAFVHRYEARATVGAALPAPAGPTRPTVDVPRRTTLARFARRGATIAVHVPADARIDVRIVASPKRRDGRRREVVLARASRATTAGTVRIAVRPRGAVRRWLRRRDRDLTATARIVVRPRTGGSRTLRRGLHLTARR